MDTKICSFTPFGLPAPVKKGARYMEHARGNHWMKTGSKGKVRTCIKLLMLVSIFLLASCTHLDKPSEITGKSLTYLDWGKTTPGAKDRARHDISGTQPFEWWYFDGHLDTGETFVGVFLDPSFTTGRPGVAFSLYSRDWKKESRLLTLTDKEMKTSTEEIDIACPAGYVHNIDDKTFLVGWDIEGLQADFKLTTIAPGWIPRGIDGVNEDSRDFFWTVHQARNSIEGTITKDGKTRRVSGVGYADHNWGKKPLNEITRSWLWGRILAGEYTIIYADVNYLDPSIMSRPLYIAKGDKIIAGTGSPIIRQWDFVTDPDLERFYPRQIGIDYVHDGLEAHIHIRFITLVEAVDLLTVSGLDPVSQWFARTFVARPTYFRIIARYDGVIIEDGRPNPVEGECLYEVMGFE